MASLTEITIPTTETDPKDVPNLSGSQLPVSASGQSVMLACLLVLAVLVVAYHAATVILPIVLAIVLKMLLQPLMRAADRLRIPRVLAALVILTAMIALLVLIGMIISGPAVEWAQRLPEGLPRLQERLRFLSEPLEKMAAMLRQIDSLGQAAGAPAIGLGLTAVLFAGTQHFAAGLFETLLILFFLLSAGDTFLRRFVELLPRFGDKRQAVAIAQQIEGNVSAYLVTITIMNALVGVGTGLAVWACGMGDPLLWGTVAFLLNYVPIMGPLVGVVVFLFAGLLTIEHFWLALMPALLYFTIHAIEGEFVTPMLLARRFTLNPVLVIISLIFWFWMWGVPGAVLAVPMLAITKIICDGVRPLNAIGHFLEGNAPSDNDV